MEDSAARFVPASHSLDTLRAAAARCAGCELYRRATHTVFGEGRRGAHFMIVGEQPGDKEDLAGRPFVGPAGALLREAIDRSGLSPVYITNAVKHFNYVERGKRRIHAKPKIIHIRACEPWLAAEIEAVSPRLLIAMGATAMRAVFGRDVPVRMQRGKIEASTFDVPAFSTIHPSAILRMQDGAQKKQEFARFVDDLIHARNAVTHQSER